MPVPTSTPLIIVAALNIFLAPIATISNVLVFAAVRRSHSLRLPSKLLLLSLILTDLGTGVLTQPQFAALALAKATNSPNVTCVLLKSTCFAFAVLSSVCLTTMTAISVDRYIAFYFHFKHQDIVTVNRVGVYLALFWLLSIPYAWSLHLNPAAYYFTVLSALVVCLSIITVAYIRIYRGLRHHHGVKVHVQRSGQNEAGRTSLNIAKYRRSASSMMWVYGLSLVCYMPYFCLLAVTIFHYDFLLMCLHDFAVTLVFVGSSSNPFVYCYRLPEIRAEVIRTARKLLRLSHWKLCKRQLFIISFIQITCIW